MINPGDFCILVAESDAVVRWGVTDFLLRRGYRVLEANSGAEAVRLANEYNGPIHVLVTDADLPERDNVSTRKLQQGRPSLQVLIISSYLINDLSSKCRQHALLKKPVSPRSVLSTIEGLLGFGHDNEN